jgi:hypothetical protein
LVLCQAVLGEAPAESRAEIAVGNQKDIIAVFVEQFAPSGHDIAVGDLGSVAGEPDRDESANFDSGPGCRISGNDS